MRKSLYSREYKALTAQLTNARKRAGITQQQLADRLKRPQSFVAKYKGGERRLDVIEFIHVCRKLGQDPAKTIKRIALANEI